ncbi:MAG: hypothetical protein ACRDDM_02405 [Paraclostridium sp.]
MGYFDKTIQVEFSLKDLNTIHDIVGRKINRTNDIFKVNELLRITNKIEDATSDYIAWYED